MNIALKIAQKVKDKGGNTYYVGGFVRDKLLGIDNKDVDIEVHGISPDDLKEVLSEFGPVLEYGKDFGIYSLPDRSIDIALPRKEKNTGRGHRDFDVYVDPYIGTLKASKRRDFTINSLMQDVITEEIIDHFNGQEDLKNKVLRHVDSETFVEDPLRVFRAAQFASRFNFEVAQETIDLCKTIDVTTLSKERVEEELKKAFLKADKPSIFFDVLNKMNKLDYWFKEINDLIGCKQDSIYHPEGDVYIHTMNVLDESTKYKNEVSDLYNFRWLCLTHDIGKVKTSFVDGDRIRAFGHETELSDMKELVKRISNRNDLYSYLVNMIENHMKPNMLYSQNSGIKSTNNMFDAVKEPKDLIYFAMCDKAMLKDRDDYLFDRLQVYEETMSFPYVNGEDLIRTGLKPDEYFKVALDYAHKLRLSRVSKENALKQTLAYIKDIKKKGDRI